VTKNKPPLRSPVEQAIWQMSAEHSTDERIDVDRFKAKSRHLCQIGTNDETRFMNLFFLHVLNQMGAGEHLPQLHKFYYTPHRRSERLLGCDMSIGFYKDPNRINTMHKLLNEKWCDQTWGWSSALDAEERASADTNNIRTLLTRKREKNELLLPYLVIHVCYCVHEYRRMTNRAPSGDFPIPGIESNLRTAIIDLQKLMEATKTWDVDVDHEQFQVAVARRLKGPLDKWDSYPAYVKAFDELSYLSATIYPSGVEVTDCFVSVEAFCAQAKELWDARWSEQVKGDK
jgi:hypothetical protein